MTVQEPKTWDNNFMQLTVAWFWKEAMCKSQILLCLKVVKKRPRKRAIKPATISVRVQVRPSTGLIHPVLRCYSDELKVSVDTKANIKANEQILIT